jgi:hypothetical protein
VPCSATNEEHVYINSKEIWREISHLGIRVFLLAAPPASPDPPLLVPASASLLLIISSMRRQTPVKTAPRSDGASRATGRGRWLPGAGKRGRCVGMGSSPPRPAKVTRKGANDSILTHRVTGGRSCGGWLGRVRRDTRQGPKVPMVNYIHL